MSTPGLVLLVLVINLIFSTTGDVLAKISNVTNNNNWFYLAILFSLVADVTFVLIIRLAGLAVPVSIVLLLTILISVFVGAIVFHEQIEVLQWVGIWMGVFSILLISNAYKIFF